MTNNGTRRQREALRVVQADMVGAAAWALPEDQRIPAVREIADFTRALTGTAAPSSLNLADQTDLAARFDAEAEKRAETGDPTAPVWAAAGEQLRLRRATDALEHQLSGEA